TAVERSRAQAGTVVVAVDVAVHHDEGLGPEERQRVGDPARGLERFGLGRKAYRHAEPASVAERLLDLVSEMSMIDDQLAEPRARQSLDGPDDHGLAAHLEQRLRRRVGQRSHALAAPGREKDRKST